MQYACNRLSKTILKMSMPSMVRIDRGRSLLSSPLTLGIIPKPSIQWKTSPALCLGSISDPLPHCRLSGTCFTAIRTYARGTLLRSPSAHRKRQDRDKLEAEVETAWVEIIEQPPPLESSPPPQGPQEPPIDPHKASKVLRRRLLAIWILVWLGLSLDFSLAYTSYLEEKLDKKSSGLSETQHRFLMRGSFEASTKEVETQSIAKATGTHPDPSFETPEQKKGSIRSGLRHYADMRPSRWIIENFAYSPATIFPPHGGDWKPWTLFTHQFCHMHVIHLAACYMASGVFFPELIRLYGTRRTVVLFLSGGALAAGLQSLHQRLTSPVGRMSTEEIKRKLTSLHVPAEEKQRLVNYFQSIAGSSGGLVALGTIGCFLTPYVQAAFLFIPVPFYIRTLMISQFIFDSIGLFYDYGLNISHKSHIAGNVAGIFMYFLFVRRMPSKVWMGLSHGQMMRIVRLNRMRDKSMKKGMKS